MAEIFGHGIGRITDRQMRARMSPLPVANRPPTGLGATEMTIDERHGNLISRCFCKRETFHRREQVLRSTGQRVKGRTGVFVALEH